MEMTELGCCIELGQLVAACELGFDFVDLPGKELAALSWEAVEEIGRFLAGKGISCMGLHATLPEGIALVGGSYQKEELGSYMSGLILRARKLKVRYIGIGSPLSRRLLGKVTREQADLQMKEALELMCSLAPDMEILLESLNPEETNYINTLAEAYEMVRKVERENIGLVWDIYHFLKSGEQLGPLPKGLYGYVKYLHIADPTGRRYPSKDSSGMLFETMAAAVERTGAGYLAIEAVSREFEADAAQGRRILQQQLEQRKENTC